MKLFKRTVAFSDDGKAEETKVSQDPGNLCEAQGQKAEESQGTKSKILQENSPCIEEQVQTSSEIFSKTLINNHVEESKRLNDDNKDEDDSNKDKDDQNLKIRYFYIANITNENQLKKRFNRAIKKGMNLQEILKVQTALEALLGIYELDEKIIQEYIKSMSEFDKNVIYLGLEKDIKNQLSRKTQKKLASMQKEFDKIKENYFKYESALDEAKEYRKSQYEKKATMKDINKRAGESLAEEEEEEKQEKSQMEDSKEDEEKGEEEEEIEYDDYELVFKTMDESSEKKDDDAWSQSEDSDGLIIENHRISDANPKKELQSPDKIYAEQERSRNSSPKSHFKACSTRREVSEETQRTVRSFRFDDTAILNVCRLLFISYIHDNEAKPNKFEKIEKFLTESVGSNPSNLLRIIDTLLFVLYTPEMFEKNTNIDLSQELTLLKDQITSLCNYETIVQNLVQYLCDNLKDPNVSYVYFTPAHYLNKFGNGLLGKVKSQTGYFNKLSRYYSIVDMILGLLGKKYIIQTGGCGVVILTAFQSLLTNDKKVSLLQDNFELKSLDHHKPYISKKIFDIILNLIDQESVKIEGLSSKVEDLLISLEKSTQIFITLQSQLLDRFIQLVSSVNKKLEICIQRFREFSEEAKSKNNLDEILLDLPIAQFRSIKAIMNSFANTFHSYLFSGNSGKILIHESLFSILEDITENYFNQSESLLFFLNVYEITSLIHKSRNVLKISNNEFEPCVLDLVLICLYHYSMVMMLSEYKSKHKNIAKYEENRSVEHLSSPSWSISSEEKATIIVEAPELPKTFSQYKEQNSIDFRTIFANFAFKFCKAISQLSQIAINESRMSLNNILSFLIPMCPWMLDLEAKRKIMM